MKIAWSPYELETVSKEVKRNGALLRFEFAEGLGYAAIQPWEVFGDLPLEDQIRKLYSGERTDILARAIECAKVDADCRAKNRSAFEGMQIPSNHFLVIDLDSISREDIEHLIDKGIESFKVKIGKNIDGELGRLEPLFAELPVSLRLDANAQTSFSQISEFWTRLSDEVKGVVELIEDPCPYNRENWIELSKKFPIALDLEWNQWLLDKEPLALDYLVLKPEVQDVEAIVESHGRFFKHWVVTSYLGHPLGQSWAAYCASKLPKEKLGVCGLNSHFSYVPTEFSRDWCDRGPQSEFSPHGFLGLGFEAELEKQNWMDHA